MDGQNAIKRKLSSENGESITEVLVASLVIAFGSIILATMVMASTRIIKKSIDAYDKYISIHNAVEMLDQNGKIGYLSIGEDGMTITDASDTEKRPVGYIDSKSESRTIANGSLHLFIGDVYQSDNAKDISLSGGSMNDVEVYAVSLSPKKEGEASEPQQGAIVFSRYFG